MRSMTRAASFAALSIAIVACSTGFVPSSAGISTDAPSSAQPSAPASPSQPATPASPSTEPQPDGAGLDRDGYVRVITNDLRVRSKPGVSSDSVKLTPLLDAGVVALVLDGPVAASGYQWYLISPVLSFEQEELPFGWVAAGSKEGEAWLAPTTVECPPIPTDLDSLAALNETDRMHFEIGCYSRESVTFPARLGSPEAMCGIEVPWGIEPDWFDHCSAPGYFLVAPDQPYDRNTIFPIWHPSLDLSFAPDPQAAPATWPVVSVTIQFDHPEARTCRLVENYSEPAVRQPIPEWAELQCRLQFVVTAISVIG